MQKSCLTLILVAPDRMQANCMSQPHPLATDYPMNDAPKKMQTNQITSTMTPNIDQLDDNSRSTSTTISCDQILLNETVIPIKYFTNDRHSTAPLSSDKVLSSKANYCCTLEVKFIRYVVLKRVRFSIFSPRISHFIFSFGHFFSNQIAFFFYFNNAGMSCHRIFWINRSNYSNANMVVVVLDMPR